MKAVEYIRDKAPYRAGEIATWPDFAADKLIADGIAKAHTVVDDGAKALPDKKARRTAAEIKNMVKK